MTPEECYNKYWECEDFSCPHYQKCEERAAYKVKFVDLNKPIKIKEKWQAM